MSDCDPNLTLSELKEKLLADPVARAKYTASAIEFWESNGLKVTDEILKKFDDDAIQTVLGGAGGAATLATNVIAVF